MMTTSEPVGRINRIPSAPPLDAADLDWLIEQYLDDRRIKVVAKTIQSYECRLRIVIEWWQEVGPTQNFMLHAADLIKFEHYLRDKASTNTGQPLSYTYRKGVLQSLREALCWAYQQGYVTKDYSHWVPAAHGAKKRRHAANEDDLLRLLAECDNSSRRIRDRAIIAIFIGMGLRCAEVSNLKVEHIHFAEDLSGYANVRGKRTKANPTGERDSAFDSATGAMISDYIGTLLYTTGPLFVSYRDVPLKPYTLYGIVKKLIIRAGLEDKIQACHDLRRAFATYYARNKKGADSADLRRRQLGHASYSQTTDYTLYEIDDIRRDIVSPVSNFQAYMSAAAPK